MCIYFIDFCQLEMDHFCNSMCVLLFAGTAAAAWLLVAARCRTLFRLCCSRLGRTTAAATGNGALALCTAFLCCAFAIYGEREVCGS